MNLRQQYEKETGRIAFVPASSAFGDFEPDRPTTAYTEWLEKKLTESEPKPDYNGWTPVFKEMECFEPISGKWKVTHVSFLKGNTAIVEQEDGHIWTPKQVREYVTPEQKLEKEAEEHATKKYRPDSDSWHLTKDAYIAGANSRTREK